MNILSTCSNYLKKGGIIVYSTCSILKQENSKIIQEFTKKNKNFEILSVENKNLDKIKNKKIENGMLEIYPNEKMDGFFIAKLYKK